MCEQGLNPYFCDSDYDVYTFNKKAILGAGKLQKSRALSYRSEFLAKLTFIVALFMEWEWPFVVKN